MLEERLPESFRERIHPACAKKLIEGAIAYAESFGFAPHRDFRKARKVLSGIDSDLCPRDFTYGCEGRPRYVRGEFDSDERADRVLAMLEARCGSDGFDYEDLMADDGEAAQDVRDDLVDFLDAEPTSVPRFYETSGLITALLICPTFFSPLKVMEALWGPEGKVWEDSEEAQEFADLLMQYWNQVNDLILVALDPATDAQILDIWSEDLECNSEKNSAIALAVASMEWAKGFLRATTLWPEAWGDARQRPELIPHWELIGWWAKFEKKENRDLIATHGEAKPPRTLNTSVIALARALRPLKPPIA